LPNALPSLYDGGYHSCQSMSSAGNVQSRKLIIGGVGSANAAYSAALTNIDNVNFTGNVSQVGLHEFSF